jgi:hypothetical protein
MYINNNNRYRKQSRQLYRLGRAHRVPKYSYSNAQFPALCREGKAINQKNWEHIVAPYEQEENIIADNEMYDNLYILEAEEQMAELDERNNIYKQEDDMRYGINRMNEWDRGYYEGNPYLYSWEYDKMHDFTEALGGDMEDELD